MEIGTHFNVISSVLFISEDCCLTTSAATWSYELLLVVDYGSGGLILDKSPCLLKSLLQNERNLRFHSSVHSHTFKVKVKRCENHSKKLFHPLLMDCLFFFFNLIRIILMTVEKDDLWQLGMADWNSISIPGRWNESSKEIFFFIKQMSLIIRTWIFHYLRTAQRPGNPNNGELNYSEDDCLMESLTHWFILLP